MGDTNQFGTNSCHHNKKFTQILTICIYFETFQSLWLMNGLSFKTPLTQEQYKDMHILNLFKPHETKVCWHCSSGAFTVGLLLLGV